MHNEEPPLAPDATPGQVPPVLQLDVGQVRRPQVPPPGRPPEELRQKVQPKQPEQQQKWLMAPES